jgi:hypothetical protein
MHLKSLFPAINYAKSGFVNRGTDESNAAGVTAVGH